MCLSLCVCACLACINYLALLLKIQDVERVFAGYEMSVVDR